MCNRVVQKGMEIKPGQPLYLLLKGPGGQFTLPLEGAIFSGAARSESKPWWILREGAEEVIVPDVSRFGEKSKTTKQQHYEDLPAGSALHGLLLPRPPGKDYRLVKVLTQQASPEQFRRMGNERVPVVVWNHHWARLDEKEYPTELEWVWTTDYQTVRKGRYDWGGPGTPLGKGKWEDEAGQPIAVTAWLTFSESPRQPTPPACRPHCKGGIVAFTTKEESEDENGQLPLL